MRGTITEEIRVTGRQLTGAVRQVIKKGNARKLVITTAKGKKLLETNLNLGAIGTGGLFYFAPFISAVATLVMYASDFRIQVERDVSPEEEAEYIDVEEEE